MEAGRGMWCERGELCMGAKRGRRRRRRSWCGCRRKWFVT
jgi:hypothetical protein